MESIRQAVERARAGKNPPRAQISDNLSQPRGRMDSGPVSSGLRAGGPETQEIELSGDHLQSKRIVAHNGADQRSRPYDMLRTQVLQSMSVGGWKVLGVTSPTPGCGKTVTATNLALSIARLPDHLVVLVDLDLQKPQIANSLGLAIYRRRRVGSARRAIRLGTGCHAGSCGKAADLWCCRRLPRESHRN